MERVLKTEIMLNHGKNSKCNTFCIHWNGGFRVALFDLDYVT